MSLAGYTQPLPQINSYPQIPSNRVNTKNSDEFDRETLLPTNAYVLYTSGGVGTPANTINSALSSLNIATSGAANDNTSLRSSGFSFNRTSQYIDGRSVVTIDILFSAQTTATVKAFIGVVQTNVALTTLPTTARHMGVFYDTSGLGNFVLSSANGTTQVTTDTSVAIATTSLRLNIIWTGDDSAVINLYSSTNNYTNLLKTQTVSALSMNSTLSYELHYFIQTLANSSAALNTQEWQISIT